MSISTLIKLGKTLEELIPTNMKKFNFRGEASTALGVLIAEVTVGPKSVKSAFFVVDGKPSYSVILGRGWIHTAQCVPSKHHQRLMFWVGDNVEVVEAEKNPFTAEVKMLESLFYSPHLGPIEIPEDYVEGSWETCSLTREGFKVKPQVDSRPKLPSTSCYEISK